MKRFGLWLTVVLVILALAGMAMSVMAAMGKMSPKGQEVSVTGRVTCTFCSLSHAMKSCPKGCCANCLKAGDPALLVDMVGNMYLLTNNEKQVKLMTPARMAMAGDKVVVKGLLVKGKGVQVIFVDSMQKAKSK